MRGWSENRAPVVLSDVPRMHGTLWKHLGGITSSDFSRRNELFLARVTLADSDSPFDPPLPTPVFPPDPPGLCAFARVCVRAFRASSGGIFADFSSKYLRFSPSGTGRFVFPHRAAYPHGLTTTTTTPSDLRRLVTSKFVCAADLVGDERAGNPGSRVCMGCFADAENSCSVWLAHPSPGE